MKCRRCQQGVVYDRRSIFDTAAGVLPKVTQTICDCCKGLYTDCVVCSAEFPVEIKICVMVAKEKKEQIPEFASQVSHLIQDMFDQVKDVPGCPPFTVTFMEER